MLLQHCSLLNSVIKTIIYEPLKMTNFIRPFESISGSNKIEKKRCCVCLFNFQTLSEKRNAFKSKKTSVNNLLSCFWRDVLIVQNLMTTRSKGLFANLFFLDTFGQEFLLYADVRSFCDAKIRYEGLVRKVVAVFYKTNGIFLLNFLYFNINLSFFYLTYFCN